MTATLARTLLVVAIPSLLSPARAESLVAGTSLTGVAPGSSVTVEVARFRPELGTLRSVSVELVLELSSELSVENLGDGPAGAGGRFGCTARLGVPQVLGGVQVALESPKFSLDLGPFDGAVDFAGTSGAYLEHDAVGSSSCEAGADLARFLARSPGDALSLPLELVDTASIDLPPAAAGGASALADVHVVVRYEYEPAGSPGLIGMPGAVPARAP